jgi:hypothetical protein
MGLGSLFTVIVLFVALLAMAGAGFYFYTSGRSWDFLGFFTPRIRRLAFIERAYLDGGRKLLLVRRDNVEHLILIGGPIDLVVETGIPAEAYPAAAPANEDYSYAHTASWPHPEESLTPGKALEPGKRTFLAAARDTALASGKTLEPAGPQLSFPQGGEKGERKESDTLELSPLEEAKAAQ